MDKIDKKLVCALDENCRLPLTQLAKKLRVGRNVVAYRIRRLEAEKIITNYICSINLGFLGFRTYKIYFKTSGSKVQEPEFIRHVIQCNNVIHFLKTEGAFDFAFAFASRTVRELDTFLTELKTKFRDFVKDYIVTIIVYSKIFKLDKLLLDKPEPSLKFDKYSSEEVRKELGEKDIKILGVLSQRANIPLTELAKETGLSVDIVKYRLRNLTREFVSSFRAMLDLGKMGYYHYVLLLNMRKADKADEERLLSWCTMKKQVLFCTKRIGGFDFEVNVALGSIDELNNFLSEFREEFSETLDSYEVIINTKMLKLNYFQIKHTP